MSDLSPRGRALVEAARGASATPEDRARVRAALAARLGAAALPGGAPPPALGAATGGLAKAIAIGALLGGVVVGAGSFASRERTSAPMVSAQATETAAPDRAPPPATPRATEPAPIAPAAAPSALPAPIASAQRHDRAPVAALTTTTSPPSLAESSDAPATPAPRGGSDAIAAVPPESSLLDETRTLREAQTAMQGGDTAGALARLDDLGKRHPEGVLREERLAAHILALCAAGRETEARQEAERFLAEVPASIQAGRVRASCAFTGNRGSR